MKSTVVYRYVGTGSLAGIPARDLSEAEALEHGVKLLLSSGLYRKETNRREQPDDDTFEETEVTE